MKLKFSIKFFLKWTLVIAFIVFLIFILKTKPDSFKNLEINNIEYVKIAGQIIKIEVATTPEAQEKGLSERNEIKDDEGMLFIFKNPGWYSFWMKDMNFPIDMIWLDQNLQVIYIKKNVLPESFPETFSPKEKSQYVLEVISGFSEKNNLTEGDTAQFLP